MRFELLLSGRKYAVDAEGGLGVTVVKVGSRTVRLGVERIDSERIRVTIDQAVKKVELIEETANGFVLKIDGEKFTFEWPPYLQETGEGAHPKFSVEKDLLLSPLPGTVTTVEVRNGQMITPGTPLVVIEAMKMESIIRSDRGGRISKILVKKAESVRKGQPLIQFSRESR